MPKADHVVMLDADTLGHALNRLRKRGFVVVHRSLLTREQMVAREKVALVLRQDGCWEGFGPYRCP